MLLGARASTKRHDWMIVHIFDNSAKVPLRHALRLSRRFGGICHGHAGHLYFQVVWGI